MWIEGGLQPWVLLLQGLRRGLQGGRGAGLLPAAVTTLCPLFSKILSITLHVTGIWGGPYVTGKLARRSCPSCPLGTKKEGLGFALSPYQDAGLLC